MIICDVMMPPPNGFEVRRLLSLAPTLASIPFLFLTARTGMEDRVDGINIGADDYITKPFEPKELVARVQAVFRRIERERAHGRDQMKVIAEKEMDRLRREILQNYQHEMGTPLTNILLSLESVLNQRFQDPEEQTRFIRVALSNAERLDSLTTDFMLLTNIDRGEMNMIRQPIDLEIHILPRVRRRLERYQAKDLHLVTEFSIQGKITAPRREFTQAILHVLDNAFKFSPEHGTVKFSVSSNEKGDATLCVCDEGPGIPTDLREKVFERFFQGSQGSERKWEGLGIGLTLARIVLVKMGGRVKILDTSQGCCVEIYLPGPTPEDIMYDG
jgi:signal transduction histidine kinase